MIARLLVVLGGALCLWLLAPGAASASSCGGAGYRAQPAPSPLQGTHTCNSYAVNGATVAGAVGATLAAGFALSAYWKGARAERVVQAWAGRPRAWNPQLNRPEPRTTYYVHDTYQVGSQVYANTFGYMTDHLRRTVMAAARLDAIGKGVRNPYRQRVAGRGYRLAIDQGGHTFGTQFLAPGEGINISAMLADLNAQGNAEALGAYYKMEDLWADYIRQGRPVDVVVEQEFSRDSLRPRLYVVRYSVAGGVPSTAYFSNSP